MSGNIRWISQKSTNLNNVPFLCTKLFFKRGHYSRGDIIQGRTLFMEIRYVYKIFYTWIGPLIFSFGSKTLLFQFASTLVPNQQMLKVCSSKVLEVFVRVQRFSNIHALGTYSYCNPMHCLRENFSNFPHGLLVKCHYTSQICFEQSLKAFQSKQHHL